MSELLLALLVGRWREALGCDGCPLSCGDALLDVVDCDQRFKFPMLSRNVRLGSIAVVGVAALLRRLVRGGVAGLLWGLDGSGFIGSLSEREAGLLTVVTDEDMELLRDDWRRACWAGPDRSAEGGAAASDV